MNEKIRELRLDAEKARCYFSKKLAFTLGPVENMIKLVDVRSASDYEVAHIPSAISIPKEELSQNTDKLSKNEITVIYCYNQQCHLGAEACLILAEYGYPVMLLEGGFKTWSEDFRFATE